MLPTRSDDHRPAAWPFRLPPALAPEQIEEARRRVDSLGAAAQYGWGHTIDFGPFTKEGVLKDNFLHLVGVLDQWRWWPQTIQGLRIADVGCYTGGISLLLAHRGAAEVIAVDEIPEHVAQCDYLCELFGVESVHTLTAPIYRLPERLEAGSFDLIVLSGVLYHLSDMLVGLLILQQLLKVGGLLLMESSAVGDDEHSYANFGRFAMGMWWQPSTLCIKDMCEFMGLSDVEVMMYLPDRCLARARKTSDKPIPFRRGLSCRLDDLRDAVPRTMGTDVMAPR